MIYELVTLSDPITFLANDDKIAFACAIVLGQGKAGCHNITTGENLNTLIAFSADPEKIMNDFVGCDIEKYIDQNRKSIGECFESFAYTKPENREEYDKNCAAIKDTAELKAYKEKYENDNRTSMSKWVLSAWEYADHFLTQ